MSDGPSISPMRCSINKLSCPVRNPFESIEGGIREEGIKLFDNLFWQNWHEDGKMPKEPREWFEARVKSLKLGEILILFVIVEDLEVKMMMSVYLLSILLIVMAIH